MLLMCLARAEVFEGTNAPGTRASFSFSVAPGTTNISLAMTNTAAARSLDFAGHGRRQRGAFP